MTRHRFFTFSSVLSLLLCIGVVALWLRSYWRHDDAGMLFRRTLVSVESNMGKVAFIRIVSHTGAPRRVPRLYWASEEASFNFIWDISGGHQFSHGQETFQSPGGQAVLECWSTPCWFWAILTFILPAVMVVRKRVRPPCGPQVCRRCGYDLRASTERCPECGTPIVLPMIRGGAKLLPQA